MTRKFISTLAAAAVAMTSLTAPAQADDRDTARLLAAIAGIAVLGAIVNDRKQDKAQAVTQHNNVYRNNNQIIRRHHQPQVIQPRVQRRSDFNKRPNVITQPLNRRADRKLLPGQCLRSLQTRQGKVRMFGQRCLQNNFRHANRLPQQCGIQVRTQGGTRYGYQARCLRDFGYQLARN